MNNELGFKELYEVSIKTTLPIEVGNNVIEAGETIAFFDRIQLANFQEVKDTISAKGGIGNQPLITWDSTKEVRISFTQGIFSKVQLALMTNALLVQNNGEENIPINFRAQHESGETGEIILKYIPITTKSIYVYDYDSGLKVNGWTITGNKLQLPEAYKVVIVDYWYNYNNGFTSLKIGQRLTCGFLSLTGKMKVKDDTTGKVVTGIINIPKLRLMSDLSMRVGSDAIPQVGRLDAVAVPEGARGQSKVMEIIFLNDDIDADM